MLKQRVLTVNDLSLLAEPFRIIDFNTTNGVNYILLALVFCYEFEPDLPTPSPAGTPCHRNEPEQQNRTPHLCGHNCPYSWHEYHWCDTPAIKHQASCRS